VGQRTRARPGLDGLEQLLVQLELAVSQVRGDRPAAVVEPVHLRERGPKLVRHSGADLVPIQVVVLPPAQDAPVGDHAVLVEGALADRLEAPGAEVNAVVGQVVVALVVAVLAREPVAGAPAVGLTTGGLLHQGLEGIELALLVRECS
jgi:hypothetical protein